MKTQYNRRPRPPAVENVNIRTPPAPTVNCGIPCERSESAMTLASSREDALKSWTEPFCATGAAVRPPIPPAATGIAVSCANKFAAGGFAESSISMHTGSRYASIWGWCFKNLLSLKNQKEEWNSWNKKLNIRKITASLTKRQIDRKLCRRHRFHQSSISGKRVEDARQEST